MKKLFCSLFLLPSILTIKAQPGDWPAELKPYILQGYTVLDFIKGDLNNDKLEDYILILKTNGEDTTGFDNPDRDAARPLLILTRQTDGTLKSEATNASVVLCKHCGGVMGDPYQGVTIKTGEFSISFYGGSSWRWTTDYTFRYDVAKKNWFLQSHGSSSFQSGDPERTLEETFIDRTEIGDITIEKFSPYYNTDSTTWKVNVAKAYFYANPDIRSKPKKAYLVKGNTVTAFRKFKNFIQCSFTNAKGTTTSGFLLRKDLLLLSSAASKAAQ